jgi:hypothetical protein
MAEVKRVTDFRKAEGRLEIIPPKILGERKILEVYYPHHDAERANVLNGQTECPFNSFNLETTLVFPIATVQALVEAGDADYCWNHCTITDCPAYIANREK